jgi:choline kinase
MKEPYSSALDKQTNLLLYIRGCTIMYNKIRFNDHTQSTTLEKVTGRKQALLIYRVATDPLLIKTVSHKVYSTNYS